MLLSILCAAHALGLMPDSEGEILARRKLFVEALTLHCATVIQQGDDAAVLKAVANTLAERNPDVVSMGLRKVDGGLLFQIGDHESSWGNDVGEFSTPTHWHVPLRVQDKLWGKVEVCCQPLHRPGVLGLWDVPLFRLGAFAVVVGLIGIYFYLNRVLRHAGARNKSVVPDRVKETLNTVVEGVLVLDKQERIAFANDAFVRTVGVPGEQLQGTKASALPWNKSPAHGDLPWNRVLKDGNALVGSLLKLRQQHQKSRLVSVNSTGIRDDKGTCLGALATFDDMTAIQNRNTRLRRLLRRLERSRRKIIRQRRQLRVAKEIAEAANQAKGDFLANVSHEIRTPMNAILGMTDVLLETRIAADQKEYLETVKSSADALLVLINDLLDFSKIEAGKFTLDPIDFDVRECVGETLKALALRANAKYLELACDIGPEVHEHLVGDPVRLRQILINLVGNAIKFTSQGEIVVRARLEAQDEQHVRVHFTIADTGIGIPANKLQQIFDPFTQADGSTTRRFGGTGLGLTISARLVELMGGKIWVESEVGQGSRFHFTANFERSARHETFIDPALGQLSLLVVDDHLTSQQILADMVGQLGMRATVVSTRAEAVELLRTTKFSAALVDTSIDGAFDLLATHRGRTVFVPMVCSADRVQELSRCRQAGIETTLAKPFQRTDLVRVLRTTVLGGENEQVSEHSPQAALPRLRILVVDDNDFNQRVARLKLEKNSDVVRTVNSGPEALAILEREPFDLVLLDLLMPEMDGYEVTAAIRKREQSGPYPSGRRLPVVAMTAHALDEVRQKCDRIGMDGYLVKPIRDRELWDEIRRLAPHDFVAQPTRKSALDPSVALARVGGNAGLLQEMLDVFVKDCAALTAEIQQAVGKNDAATIARAGHTIKGMVDFFGASAATEKAVHLETLGKQGDLGPVRDVLAELEYEVDQIRNAFLLESRL